MKAMILAAGLGTRLRPLTDTVPKALVEVAGRTLLEITLCRLRNCGVSEVIVNVHHFADRIVDYLRTNDNFGMRVQVSREEILLDTGGGLKNASYFFQSDALGVDEPFILHNVDVLSTIDLRRMLQFHNEHHALASLAVQNRESSRSLLFDEHLQLCGRRSGRDTSYIVRPAEHVKAWAFSGIHVISPRLIQKMGEGVFSIITSYLHLAAEGESILAFDASDSYWRDLGTPDSLLQAAQDMKQIAQLQ